MVFTIKGHPIKKYGSQGQQKSLIIAMRLAQYELLKEHLALAPILLLDDIFDKLDNDRVKRLLDLVSEHYFGQVLVTDTDEDRLNAIFRNSKIEFSMFRVSQGEIHAVDSLEIKMNHGG